jgi:hypothetical protein
MKLIGSQLMTSKRSLFYEEEGRRLRNVLQQSFPLMTTAHILHWIPEQGEDIYKVLINDSLIVENELDSTITT